MFRTISVCLLFAVALALTGCSKDKTDEGTMNRGEQTVYYTEPATDAPAETDFEPYDELTEDTPTEAYTVSEDYPTEPATRYHVVAKKETLFSLARRYYGDQAKWRDIYEANRSKIKDPDKIFVGQRLVIP